ncbi:unnamed protein product [Aphanomyces euteiches]
MDIDKPTYYCATDPTIIDDLLAFSNSNVVTQIPKVAVYYTSSVCHFAPTGNSFRVTGSGFLDATPNATAVMLPLSLVTNRREMGIFSRIDYIIQTQVGILVASRIATALLYLILLIKFSWTNRQNLLQILVENFTFEVTNKSPVDTTAVLTLAMTYWTYREIMLSMVVRQCLSPLPWNSAVLHTYMDDLIFIPGPVCYVFLFGLCAAKHILHSFQICVRLAYVAVYLAIVILVAGAVSNQGPASTAANSVEPYSLKPTLVAPMILYYYRTSQHVDSYYCMAYATFVAILLPPFVLQSRTLFRSKLRSSQVGSEIALMKADNRHTSFDTAVGLVIRFPGGFQDRRRMYTRRGRFDKPRSTLYSLGMSGYVQIDGYLMETTSICRCFAAFSWAPS